MTATHGGTDAGTAFIAPPLPDDVELWLLRHGETEWSRSGQHTSTTDLPLTENGERQARAMGSMLAGLQPALVLCSPRRRAQETAELAGLKIDDIDADLVEWNYGAYEGITTADIRKDVPGWTLFGNGVPDGETAEQIGERADRVLTRAAAAMPTGPVVLIGHGHFSRVLGARWIGLPVSGGAKLLLGTAAPSLLGAQHGEPVIVHWNVSNPAAERTP
jgi:broad specificity phosphatase PhoE